MEPHIRLVKYKTMKKVPLYTLQVDDKFIINNLTMQVTATKNIVKNGKQSYQNIYCKQVDGNQFLHAPAGLMVTKVE